MTLGESERVLPLLLEMRQSAAPEERYQASLMLALSDYAADPDQGKAAKRIDLKVGILEERTQAYKAAVRTFCEVSLNALDNLDATDDEQTQAYIALARFALTRLAQASDIAVPAVSVTLDELLESPSPAVRLFACAYDIESGRLKRTERVSREVLTGSLSDLSFQTQAAALIMQWVTQTQVVGNQLTILQKMLNNPQVLVRHEAAHALGISGDEIALNDLIAALDDEDSKVREWAAYGLGLMANPAALSSLAEHLVDKNEKEQVRVDTVSALGKLGDCAAIPHLVDALGDESHKIRAAAAYGLGWLGDRSVVLPLIEALNDENRDVRQNVVGALGRLQYTKAIQPLIKALTDENSGVRLRAAYALGQLGTFEAVPALITTLEDKNKQVQQYVAQALGKLGNLSAVRPLRKALESAKWGDFAVIQNIITALRQLGSSIDAQALTKALESEHWETQAVAAFILAYADETTAYEPCLLLLKHKDDRVRFATIYAIVRLGKEFSLQHLRTALTDKASAVRMTVMWGANYAFDLTTVEEIIVGLGDGDNSVRQYSVAALRNLMTSSTQSILITTLSDNDPAVRRQTAIALGRLGNSKAVPPLIHTLLRDPAAEVRQAATWALGKLGDRTCTPYLMRQFGGETAQALARMEFTEMIPLIVAAATVETDSDEATAYAFSLVHLNVEVALNVLDQYERQYQTSSWVPHLRGFALTKLGKTEAALVNFHAALNFAPDSALYQRSLAMFHIEQGDLAQAANYISQEVIHPLPSAYTLLAHAVILWLQGKRNLALEQFTEAQRWDRHVTDIEDLRFDFWGPKALATIEQMLAQ